VTSARSRFLSDRVGLPASLAEPGHADSRQATGLLGARPRRQPNVNLLRQAAIGSRSRIASATRGRHPLSQPTASAAGQLDNAPSSHFGGTRSQPATEDSRGARSSFGRPDTPRARFHGTASAPPWTRTSLPKASAARSAVLPLRLARAPRLLSRPHNPDRTSVPSECELQRLAWLHVGPGCLISGSAPAWLDTETRRPTFGPAVTAPRPRAVLR